MEAEEKLCSTLEVTTGYCRLVKHMHNMSFQIDSTCRLCLKAEDTKEHLVAPVGP